MSGGIGVGAEVGMNFINKGIDQFSYGVSEEYNKYKYEKSRDDARYWDSTKMDRRMKDAKRFGIHPLAMLGASPSSSPAVSYPSSIPPSGGGSPISGSRDNDELVKAQIRKLDAETNAINGQAPVEQKSAEQFPSSSTGIEMAVNPQMKYEMTPEGFYNLIARDNEAYSDEAPITTQAQFLWDDVARRSAGRRLLHNWNNPKMEDRKKWLLESRPSRVPKGYIALWNVQRGQWQKVKRTSQNKHRIFNQEIPGRNIRKQYKRKPTNDNYMVN